MGGSSSGSSSGKSSLNSVISSANSGASDGGDGSPEGMSNVRARQIGVSSGLASNSRLKMHPFVTIGYFGAGGGFFGFIDPDGPAGVTSVGGAAGATLVDARTEGYHRSCRPLNINETVFARPSSLTS